MFQSLIYHLFCLSSTLPQSCLSVTYYSLFDSSCSSNFRSLIKFVTSIPCDVFADKCDRARPRRGSGLGLYSLSENFFEDFHGCHGAELRYYTEHTVIRDILYIHIQMFIRLVAVTLILSLSLQQSITSTNSTVNQVATYTLTLTATAAQTPSGGYLLF